MAVTWTYAPERLTWKEIDEKYPNTWVGLSDIKFENNDNTNIDTAVVSATGTRDELYDELFAHRIQMVSPTNVERFMFDNWAIWDVKVV